MAKSKLVKAKDVYKRQVYPRHLGQCLSNFLLIPSALDVDVRHSDIHLSLIHILVYLDFANSTANVLIYGNELERKDVEIIGELVTKNTGIALHKISIMDGL